VIYPREFRDREVRVEIKEYKLDRRTGEYPEEAFPGAFYFNADGGGYLALTLHFVRSDFEVLIPIILSSPTVHLSASLSVTQAEIANTKEVLRGEITRHSFSFSATKMR
jgi:hypothetical protein